MFVLPMRLGGLSHTSSLLAVSIQNSLGINLTLLERFCLLLFGFGGRKFARQRCGVSISQPLLYYVSVPEHTPSRCRKRNNKVASPLPSRASRTHRSIVQRDTRSNAVMSSITKILWFIIFSIWFGNSPKV